MDKADYYYGMLDEQVLQWDYSKYLLPDIYENMLDYGNLSPRDHASRYYYLYNIFLAQYYRSERRYAREDYVLRHDCDMLRQQAEREEEIILGLAKLRFGGDKKEEGDSPKGTGEREEDEQSSGEDSDFNITDDDSVECYEDESEEENGEETEDESENETEEETEDETDDDTEYETEDENESEII